MENDEHQLHKTSEGSSRPAGKSGDDSTFYAIPLKTLAAVIAAYLVVAGFTYNYFFCGLLGIPSNSIGIDQASFATQAFPVLLRWLGLLLVVISLYLLALILLRSNMAACRLASYGFVTLGFVFVLLCAAGTGEYDARYTLRLKNGGFIGRTLSIRPDRANTYPNRFLHAANSAGLFIVRQNAEFYFVLLPANVQSRSLMYWIPKGDLQHGRSELPSDL